MPLLSFAHAREPACVYRVPVRLEPTRADSGGESALIARPEQIGSDVYRPITLPGRGEPAL